MFLGQSAPLIWRLGSEHPPPPDKAPPLYWGEAWGPGTHTPFRRVRAPGGWGGTVCPGSEEHGGPLRMGRPPTLLW